jgi:hypothetical protein
MPKYVYYCKECDETFETKHSLQETCTVCELCGTVTPPHRRPSAFFLTNKDEQSIERSEVGAAVKRAIEESRQDLKQDQGNLKERVYKK